MNWNLRVGSQYSGPCGRVYRAAIYAAIVQSLLQRRKLLRARPALKERRPFYRFQLDAILTACTEMAQVRLSILFPKLYSNSLIGCSEMVEVHREKVVLARTEQPQVLTMSST